MGLTERVPFELVFKAYDVGFSRKIRGVFVFYHQ